MIWLKLFTCLISALAFLYFFLYWKQLRLIRREIKQIANLRLLFVCLVMMLLTAVVTGILLFSIGLEAFTERFF